MLSCAMHAPAEVQCCAEAVHLQLCLKSLPCSCAPLWTAKEGDGLYIVDCFIRCVRVGCAMGCKSERCCCFCPGGCRKQDARIRGKPVLAKHSLVSTVSKSAIHSVTLGICWESVFEATLAA